MINPELNKLLDDYLRSLPTEWYAPYNTQYFDGYKGCFKLSQDLFELGYLEKRQLKNGLINFKKK